MKFNIYCQSFLFRRIFSDENVFYDSKQKLKLRQLKAAEMNARARPQRTVIAGRRAHPSGGQAFQLLQQTMHFAELQPLTAAAAVTGRVPAPDDFRPSKRLQELFERCLQTTHDDSAGGSSEISTFIDYDALAFSDDKLMEMWSQMCGSPMSDARGGPLLEGHLHVDNNEGDDDDDDDDIDLDVDYDLLLNTPPATPLVIPPEAASKPSTIGTDNLKGLVQVHQSIVDNN